MDLEGRIQRLEDVAAIKRLKARYCGFCDDGYDPEGLASLFTADAVWDGGAFGRCEGTAQIRSFFANAPNTISFAIHHVTNPRIDVHGDRATGDWYLFQPCTLAAGDRAVWLAARYRDEYRRADGEWKFARVELETRFFTPFDEGWAKTPRISGGNA
jgi:hypothetical protein